MTLNAAIPGLAITGCIFAGILAIIHIYIFILEAILWKRRGAQVFRLSQSVVESGATLAANQGFYNLLLAAGLIWGLAELNGQILLFFLAAISTAGIFGALTASPRILLVQVLPGSLGFLFVDFGFISTEEWSYWRHPVFILIIFVVACFLTLLISFVVKRFFLNSSSKTSTKSNAIHNDAL